MTLSMIASVYNAEKHIKNLRITVIILMNIINILKSFLL